MARTFFSALPVWSNNTTGIETSSSTDCPDPRVLYRTSAPIIPAATIAPVFHPTAAVGIANPLLVLAAAVVAAAVA